MKILPLVAAGCLAISVSLSLANGGGYAYHSASKGDLEFFVPKQAEHVQILTEDLHIDLGDDQASVEVRYTMKNQGEAREVEIGFPVERTETSLSESGEEDPQYELESQKKKPKFTGFPSYSIQMDGKNLAAAPVDEPARATQADKRRVGLDGWMVSKLPFKANGEHSVVIRYQCGYASAQVSVSDDSRTSPKTFRYRLSTAAIWRGPILSGKISLTGSALKQPAFSIKKPAKGFEKIGDGYVWKFDNLEPTLASDLELALSYSEESYARGFEDGAGPVYMYRRVGPVWYFESSDYTVKASSTLPASGETNYQADNVKTMDPTTAWVEGAKDDGVGEWIELTAKKPKKLDHLRVENGYAKDPELWQRNNRVARVKVTLNDGKSFEASLPDTMEDAKILLKDFPEPVEKVRLEILAVHRGTKYRDTAISRIALVSKLDKKPELDPAR